MSRRPTFKDSFYTERSSLAVLCVANLVSQAMLPLSELIGPIHRDFASGDNNSRATDTAP